MYSYSDVNGNSGYDKGIATSKTVYNLGIYKLLDEENCDVQFREMYYENHHK